MKRVNGNKNPSKRYDDNIVDISHLDGVFQSSTVRTSTESSIMWDAMIYPKSVIGMAPDGTKTEGTLVFVFSIDPEYIIRK